MEGPEWAINELQLRKEVETWIREAIQRQRTIPWQGRHDEGTFASSWVGYYLLTGDKLCLEFLYWLRDTFLEWSRKNQYHGFYRIGEVHHQTETYNHFLGHLWRIEKTDVNIAVLEDVAHHIGNWVKEVPEWYDWEKHRFRSWWLGTCEVRNYPPYDFETCDHFRLITIVLNTYLATGKEQYLKLACDYSKKWCKIILEGKEIPTILYPIDDPEEIKRLYGSERSAESEGHDTVSFKEDILRYLGGDVLDALLDLYALTGEKMYVEASSKVLDSLYAFLKYPPIIVDKYRSLTGDTKYDDKIMDWIKKYVEEPLPIILMFEYEPPGTIRIREAYRASDGTIKESSSPPSSYFLLGYQISRDEKLLNKAMTLAQRRLMLARPYVRDGREHGCGYGLHRAGGEAANILCSITLGLYRFCGSYSTRVQYFKVDSHRWVLGLPWGIAALLEPISSHNERSIILYNTLEKDETIGIEITEKDAKIRGLSINGTASKDFEENRVTVVAKSKKITKVKITL